MTQNIEEHESQAARRELTEPEEGVNPWPYGVWLFFGIMIGWGVTYLALQAGDGALSGGDSRSFLVKEADTSTNNTNLPQVDGSTVFKNICMACHQSLGQGIPGAFPPLAGSEWVTGDPDIPAKIILFGLQGPIDVKGSAYNSIMPAFGATLSDGEIAAVVSYIRKEWSNSASAISIDNVKQLRSLNKGRSAPWTAAELRQTK